MTRFAVSATLVLAAALSLTSYVAWAQMGSKSGAKTGACTITIADAPPTCQDGLTRDACYAAAKRTGGTASWVARGTCN